MHILYIDADEELLHTAERYLAESGWDVETALSAEDALAFLNSTRYDAVVTEEELPGMSGVGLLVHLRATGNMVPVVFFSDTDDTDAVVAALNAGAARYLRKGLAPEDAFPDVRDAVSRIGYGVQTSCSPLSMQSEMRMILDSSNEPTVFIDKDRTILWANRAFYSSLGVGPVDAVGRHCYEVVWGRSGPCGMCRIPKVLSSGHSVSSEVRYPGGGSYWITTYPVKDDNGVLYSPYRTDYPRIGYHPVTFFQLGDHLLTGFLAFLLRTNHEKVHHQKYQREHQKHGHTAAPAAFARLGHQ